MAYPFAAFADWLVCCSRHPVSYLLGQWLGLRFTVLCASVCVVHNTACVLVFAPRCWLIYVPVVVRDACLSMQACSCPMCLCRVSRIDRNQSADSWFVCAAPTSMGSSSITWCYFFLSASFSRATSVAVPRARACTFLNRWPAKALSVNHFRKLTTLPSSPIAHPIASIPLTMTGEQCQHFVNMFVSRLEQLTTKSYFLRRRRQMVTFWAKYDNGCDEVSSWSERLTVSFVSAEENLYFQKKLNSIKQRPAKNTTAYILRFFTEAKLAYPTA